ncbi:hypothetical protein G5714_006479 [Onychostoma macrolepis]|uniref:PLA2c domain-containing protein n=1 Tax=Onychostoma macrolepis TaxID=369639 RepID=A0A7J6D474_9TELE|nr:hypothetical protein G5714_006479 [Onychostoma macrolepis]
MVGLLGSLVQLEKAEPDWSTKLETVTDKIIERLSGPAVSWGDTYEKLKKYYNGKDFFSLTDIWAAMGITTYVKEIDEHTLTDQWDHFSKSSTQWDHPFPIYTVIDKQCKQSEDEKDTVDPWFEISPYEAGYSLCGAFVDTSSFGSQFDNGSKKKLQPEMDMLYLQALCGSALADEVENKKFIWEYIKDPNSPHVEKCYQVLMDLADMNLCVLNGKDPSALHQSIRTTLNELNASKSQLSFPTEKQNLAGEEATKLNMKQHTEDVCNDLSLGFSFWPDVKMWTHIYDCMNQWIWGRNYDFVYNMKDEAVTPTLLKSETRDYEDAGLLLNSPYFSVLRKERNIDLIISLDFSEDNPFMVLYAF